MALGQDGTGTRYLVHGAGVDPLPGRVWLAPSLDRIGAGAGGAWLLGGAAALAASLDPRGMHQRALADALAAHLEFADVGVPPRAQPPPRR